MLDDCGVRVIPGILHPKRGEDVVLNELTRAGGRKGALSCQAS